MTSRCADCQHRNICKYKDEYEKVLNELNIKVSAPFKLVLTCDHYYCATAYFGGATKDCADGYSNTIPCNASLSSHYR